MTSTPFTLVKSSPYGVRVTRCGDFGDAWVTQRFLRNGILFDESQGNLQGPFDCWGWGQGGVTIDSVGTYSIAAVLDPENVVEETDDSNNSATSVLRVVP